MPRGCWRMPSKNCLRLAPLEVVNAEERDTASLQAIVDAGDSGERGRNRTYNLLIKSHNTFPANQQDSPLPSADSGKVLQNPQPPRNKINHKLEE
jgi:hypothetical protein